MTDLHLDVLGSGERVVLVHGSGDPERTWADQRPLAERYRLVVPHRRGYGRSPQADPDFEVDAADVAELLDEPCHLVGFSYGAVGSLLAAARRPDGVRSLTVIEPPAFAIATGDPAVAELLARLRPVYERSRELTPEAFDTAFARAVGFRRAPGPLDPELRRVIEAIQRERPPHEAALPLAELAQATFPKLVVSGGWSPAFEAVCEVLVRELAAERAVFSEHGGHGLQHAARFNDVLEAFWARTYSSARMR
jgi:pimeloyl-ACP methyl ester carboxylesterase